MNAQELAKRAIRADSVSAGYPFRLELLLSYGYTEAKRVLDEARAEFLAEPIEEEEEVG